MIRLTLISIVLQTQIKQAYDYCLGMFTNFIFVYSVLTKAARTLQNVRNAFLDCFTTLEVISSMFCRTLERNLALHCLIHRFPEEMYGYSEKHIHIALLSFTALMNAQQQNFHSYHRFSYWRMVRMQRFENSYRNALHIKLFILLSPLT